MEMMKQLLNEMSEEEILEVFCKEGEYKVLARLLDSRVGWCVLQRYADEHGLDARWLSWSQKAAALEGLVRWPMVETCQLKTAWYRIHKRKC